MFVSIAFHILLCLSLKGHRVQGNAAVFGPNEPHQARLPVRQQSHGGQKEHQGTSDPDQVKNPGVALPTGNEQNPLLS